MEPCKSGKQGILLKRQSICDDELFHTEQSSLMIRMSRSTEILSKNPEPSCFPKISRCFHTSGASAVCSGLESSHFRELGRKWADMSLMERIAC